jgi:hypothetical protein
VLVLFPSPEVRRIGVSDGIKQEREVGLIQRRSMAKLGVSTGSCHATDKQTLT